MNQTKYHAIFEEDMAIYSQFIRKNQVFCGDVRICTYLYLFSDQPASFFDPTRSSLSIFFQ